MVGVSAPAPRPSRRLLRRVLWAVRGSVAIALLAGIAWQAVVVAVPGVAGRAVDDGVLAGDTTALLGWAAVLLALGLVRWSGDWYRHWWVDRSGMRAAVWMRARLLRRVVDLDEETAGRLGHGQLIARATSDLDTLDNWVRGLATLVTATFTLLAVTGALLTLGPVLAAVGLAVIPLTALLALTRVAPQHRAAAAMAEATGGYTGAVEEAVSGIRTVHGLGAEPVVISRAGRASAALAVAAMGRERVEASWIAVSLFLPAAGIAAGVWFGGLQVIAGTLSAGDLLAFVGWMTLLVDAVQTLTERIINRGQARAAADRLVPLLHTAPPVSGDAGPAGREIVFDRVAVDRGGRRVLDDVSLRVAPGEWVALLGASGSGKSSLLRLLPRLVDPAAGSVRIGGVALPEVDLAGLRRRVAYLGQGPVLLSGTVAENLRLAAPAADDAAVAAVLNAAAATEIVEALGPDGRVGTGGATLSGGQRQRLALARTLLAGADVLVLDDVTSALDPATEARVLHGLRTVAPRATVLLATHRLATARAADRIVVLADARVAATGTPDEILAGAGAGAAVLDLDPHLAGTT